ncbi:MAG: lysophospholipid acyltransferase family protein [Bacteroidota bacterium]
MPRKNLLYYFTAPVVVILYLLSLLPFSVLYRFSDLLTFLLYKVIGYRKKVVRKNLQNSFPEKSIREIRYIEKKFYKHFTDVMVETMKLKTLSERTLRERFVFTEESCTLLDKYYQKGQSVVIALGHNGNWEWGGLSFGITHQHLAIGVYHPLQNKIFDRYLNKMRQRTGVQLAPMKSLPRVIFSNRNKTFALVLITDQTPSKKNAFWVRFLNQDTPFFTGTEKFSTKFDLPVIWASIYKEKRGYYRSELKLITTKPNAVAKEGWITKQYAKYLEEDIRKQPETWLWSHRRWKHSKPDDVVLR